MSGSLRFALIGCGRIAVRHAELLSSQIPGARLVAVCDLKADRAEAFGRKYGVPHFESAREMLDKLGSAIDVVNILTDSGDHASSAILVAGYGKHVVVEKPMALRLEDADEMIRVCDEQGVKLFVVKQNRYNLAVQKLREAVTQKRFGKLVMATVRVRWCRDQAYYDLDAWRGTWARDGGVFSNQAAHHLDLLEWMMGSINSVVAQTARRLVDIETEDTGVCLLRFSNGALGVVEATTAARPRDLEASLSILGEGGTVVIGGMAVNELHTWEFVEKKPGDAEVLAQFRQNPPNVYGYGHLAYLNGVVQAIMHGKPALVDGLEGRKSLELITAI